VVVRITVFAVWHAVFQFNPFMHYVVNAVNHVGIVQWVTRPALNGLRSIGERRRAEVFPNIDEAKAAIAAMPLSFSANGYTFSIEEARGV
jgi:hypothetical protein